MRNPCWTQVDTRGVVCFGGGGNTDSWVSRFLAIDIGNFPNGLDGDWVRILLIPPVLQVKDLSRLRNG